MQIETGNKRQHEAKMSEFFRNLLKTRLFSDVSG